MDGLATSRYGQAHTHKLRRLLQDESDPIARYFMFSQLESDLYTCRELWSSALTEYDEVAELHHSELVEGMREALLAKFGSVPLIDTYRQEAIRSQKAGDWQGCLDWARRGLAMYGQEAARGEAVEDLEKREKRALEKLGQI